MKKITLARGLPTQNMTIREKIQAWARYVGIVLFRNSARAWMWYSWISVGLCVVMALLFLGLGDISYAISCLVSALMFWGIGAYACWFSHSMVSLIHLGEIELWDDVDEWEVRERKR